MIGGITMAYIRKEYTPEERAAYNAQKQAEMDEIIKRIDEGVKAVFQSDKYKEYLKFASKFTDYSARNTLLINLQRPDANEVRRALKFLHLSHTRQIRCLKRNVQPLTSSEISYIIPTEQRKWKRLKSR